MRLAGSILCSGLLLSGCQGVIEAEADAGLTEDGRPDAALPDAYGWEGDTPGEDGLPGNGDAGGGDTAEADEAPDPCAGVTCSGHGSCATNAGGAPYCRCDTGYHAEGLSCVRDDPCAGVGCSGHGVCLLDGQGQPYCQCDSGYHAEGLNCVDDNDPCAAVDCGGRGTCLVQGDGPVCACDEGYSPADASGLSCLPTDEVCVGGAIDYDVDDDGTADSWFEPNQWECWMFELLNRTRAEHDDEGSPECHKPLLWSVEWSAHGRNHSLKMQRRGSLFHEDYPWGQNCAWGCDPPCEMDMYMNGQNEGHCPPLSHHCNIMRCGFSHIGIGYVDTWNTQNFF